MPKVRTSNPTKGQKVDLDELGLKLSVVNDGTAVGRNLAVRLTLCGFEGGRLVAGGSALWEIADATAGTTATWRGAVGDVSFVEFPFDLPELRVEGLKCSDPGEGNRAVKWQVIADACPLTPGSIALPCPDVFATV
jgi:hypothetical protein